MAVSKEPKRSVDATVEFLDTVVKGHRIGCACEILGIARLDDPLSLPPDLEKESPRQKLAFVKALALKVVDRLTLIDSAFVQQSTTIAANEVDSDKVFNYTRVLCHYGALVMEFRDAWREGDGDRVMRCWRLLMPHFKTAGCSKYALEALSLQIQLQTLSPNLAHQIKWHRFVNTRGGLGNNIPCDLYNEHVNKLVKLIIQNMGPNLTEHSLQRAVRCVSPLHAICKHFDDITNVAKVTSAHNAKDDSADIQRVVSVVLEQKLLKKQVATRKHQSFPHMHGNPLVNCNWRTTCSWIMKKKTEFGKYKGRFRQREAEVSDEES